MIRESEEIFPDEQEEEEEEEEEEGSVCTAETNSDPNDYSIMGMRVLKVKNSNELIGNVMCKLPTEPIQLADFSTEVNAQLVYKYATVVANNNSRSVEERKAVTDFINNDMPSRPTDRNKGFVRGSAEAWRLKKNGPDHKQVLERIIQKFSDSRLIRPEKSAYQNKASLATDQAIIDSLQEEIFFTAVGNARNAGEVFLFV